MRCKKIQELILTDYIDGEMDGKAKSLIEEHLLHCADCGQTAVLAKKITGELFTPDQRANPPEFVWRRIKESIITKDEKKLGFANKFFEKIRYAFYIPNPALAFATIITLVLIFGAIARLVVVNQGLLRTNMQEQAEYYDYSLEVPEDTAVNDENSFGTGIEKYFL